MPKVRKRSSKRIGLREKYSVKKKVSAHHSKIRKEANKLQKKGIKIPFKATSKRNQIPNSFPGKEEYLNEMEARFEADKL